MDVVEFAQLTESGRQAAERGDDEAASRRYRAALALWYGRALDGSHSDQLRTFEAPRLDRSRSAAFEAMAAAELRLGRHAELVGDIRSQLLVDPLNERLHGQLMTALYRSDRRAEALAAYGQARRTLVAELGIEPGPRLRELHAQVLADDPVLLVPAAEPGRTERPPETGAASSASSVRTAHSAVRQLPPDVRHFAGRARSLAWLAGVHAERRTGNAPAPALVVGEPGVGKTAFVLHWAHAHQEDFPDGQLYVNLRGYQSSAQPLAPLRVLAAFLEALGVPRDTIPADVERAVALYRSVLAGRRLLVILDNARSAEQVRPLLTTETGSMVVITSRSSLAGLVAREGAAFHRLGVLKPDESRRLLTMSLGRERTEAEPEAVDALAEACCHLPLALRIAAADLVIHPRRPVAEQTARLRRDRLAALEAEGDEQTALRAVLDGSYRELSQGAAALFRLLGTTTVEDVGEPAAARLADLPLHRVRELLGELVHAHLLEEHAPGRYAFHDLLRDYAAERAEQETGQPEREAAEGRFHDWYLEGVNEATTLLHVEQLKLPVRLRGPGGCHSFDVDSARAWLKAEHRNIVTIVLSTADRGPRDVAWTLADGMRSHVMRRSYTADWFAMASAALRASEAEDDPVAQAAAHRNLSSAYLNQSDYANCMRHDRAAAELFGRLEQWLGLAATYNSLCLAHWYTGSLSEAIGWGRRSVSMTRRAGSRLHEAVTLSNLAAIQHEAGRLRDGCEGLRRSLPMLRDAGASPAQIGLALRNLGAVLQDLGRPAAAREHLTEALALQRSTEGHVDEAYTLFWLALDRLQAGDFAAAQDHIAGAARLDTGEPRAESCVHIALGATAQRQGEHELAAHHYRRAWELARQCHSRMPELRARLGLAAVHLVGGDHTTAYDHAQATYAAASTSGYLLFEGRALTALATIDAAVGRTARAAHRARQALMVQRLTHHRPGQADALRVLGDSLLRSRGGEAAAAVWRQALALYEETDQYEAARLRRHLAEAGCRGVPEQ
ncbi:BTAD domain-containing putative transcriptional regulator [Streptomyces sp. CC77]|uniref:ATP-binding protein n=1 Tax=Streptomyces sp. CC77 TaxID=1906739 RepID=UPI0008DDC33E|nr:BTAD domain-containing putative transcriptional regulator [Streptomyces sp. CC77]OII69384.1 hypothetical protein BJP39_04140 [Streptomyces sp. CC77]